MDSPFIIRSIQAAFFLSNIDLSDKLNVANIVKNNLHPFLNGAPTILPIPEDAPAEIPRIVLTSVDSNLICNISPIKIDLIQKNVSIKESIDKSILIFFTNIDKLAQTITTKFSANSYRLGLAITYIVDPSIKGLDLLKTKYLSNPKDISEEIQINKRLKGVIGEFEINNWLRLIAKNGSKEKDKPQLLIISDINTLQTKKYSINTNNAPKFFDSAFQLSKKNVIDSLK